MPTPAAVEPPTPDYIHLYRAAALAFREAWRAEIRRCGGDHKLANPHVPMQAAARAVQEAAASMPLAEAEAFAQRAVAWTAQAHHAWFWSGISNSAY